MNAIVIPVKAFPDAKSRLATCFSPADRAAMAEALCADIFDVVGQVRGIDRVFVVSSESRALTWAGQMGWDIVVESSQDSETAAVDAVCRHAQACGVRALLRIPTDIPLVRSSDIEEIFAVLTGSKGCVIVPSRDGTGTNALLRSPPALFPSHFGQNSFERHVAAARSAGVKANILRNSRIALDIDEAADVELLRGRIPASTRTGRWLIETDRVPPAGSGRAPIPKEHPA